MFTVKSVNKFNGKKDPSKTYTSLRLVADNGTIGNFVDFLGRDYSVGDTVDLVTDIDFRYNWTLSIVKVD